MNSHTSGPALSIFTYPISISAGKIFSHSTYPCTDNVEIICSCFIEEKEKERNTQITQQCLIMSPTWELTWKPQMVSSSGISFYSRSLNFFWHLQQFMSLKACSCDVMSHATQHTAWHIWSLLYFRIMNFYCNPGSRKLALQFFF